MPSMEPLSESYPRLAECFCFEWSGKYLPASILPSLAGPVQTAERGVLPPPEKGGRGLSGNCGRVLCENEILHGGNRGVFGDVAECSPLFQIIYIRSFVHPDPARTCFEDGGGGGETRTVGGERKWVLSPL